MLLEHARIWPTQDHYGCGGQRECHYNEVMLDAATWVRHLPHTIEAVFFMESTRHETGWLAHGASHQEYAERTRDRLATQHGVGTETIPLLSLGWTDLDAPFQPA